MKLSDLHLIFWKYEGALDFGDNNCEETWSNPAEFLAAKREAQQAVKDMKDFCEKNQIIYNGIEIL